MKKGLSGGFARWRCSAIGGAVVLLVAGCGGGGDGTALSGDPPGAKAAAAVTPAAAMPAPVQPKADAAGGARDYIVIYRDGSASSSALAAATVKPYGGSVMFTYATAVNGFAARIPAQQAPAFVAGLGTAHDQICHLHQVAQLQQITCDVEL